MHDRGVELSPERESVAGAELGSGDDLRQARRASFVNQLPIGLDRLIERLTFALRQQCVGIGKMPTHQRLILRGDKRPWTRQRSRDDDRCRDDP
ncbi:MAG TPA: hypothetical protein VFO19_15530 [Vicinamibacterales bacterium]|nr:hypothetical protein [Vicinamibacterales bacterium]